MSPLEEGPASSVTRCSALPQAQGVPTVSRGDGRTYRSVELTTLAPTNSSIVGWDRSISALMMNTAPTFTVHCEQRAGHWTSWVTAGSETKAAGAVVLVGQTQEEAEGNARRWADRLVADPRLLRD